MYLLLFLEYFTNIIVNKIDNRLGNNKLMKAGIHLLETTDQHKFITTFEMIISYYSYYRCSICRKQLMKKFEVKKQNPPDVLFYETNSDKGTNENQTNKC
jgi:hypothetical protein